MTGPELKALRKAHGLSAQKLIDMLGVKKILTVYRWESGERQMSQQIQNHIALVLEDYAIAQRKKGKPHEH